MPRPHTQDMVPRQLQGLHSGDSLRPPDSHIVPTTDAPLPPSKSQRKRDAHALQVLGAQLVAMSPAHLARLALPEALREAVVAAQGMRSHGARTRQMQYIGRLMRQLEPAALCKVRQALDPRRAATPRLQP